MAKSANLITDHEKIIKWVESRGGHPATVKSTKRGGQKAGLLRVDFPGYRGGGSLEEISWDDFFDQFDKQNLAMVFQNKTATGRVSRFNKIVAREGSVRRGPGRPRKTTVKAAAFKVETRAGRGRKASSKSSTRGPGRPKGSKSKMKSSW
ncbi:MAG: hypothetical protein A2Y07_03505 [Planctomycetes bacterium GWF2_50_10]|nr:MAG: hypothetical protein A2Y07_03505 [Planctomycetes bacterium GWF2_50_10]